MPQNVFTPTRKHTQIMAVISGDMGSSMGSTNESGLATAGGSGCV